MQNQPLVSVLMPVYNCENYILEAVESILQQTYSNFEVILFSELPLFMRAILVGVDFGK